MSLESISLKFCAKISGVKVSGHRGVGIVNGQVKITDVSKLLRMTGTFIISIVRKVQYALNMKLPTLNMCSLICVNSTSIKRFFKK